MTRKGVATASLITAIAGLTAPMTAYAADATPVSVIPTIVALDGDTPINSGELSLSVFTRVDATSSWGEPTVTTGDAKGLSKGVALIPQTVISTATN